MAYNLNRSIAMRLLEPIESTFPIRNEIETRVSSLFLLFFFPPLFNEPSADGRRKKRKKEKFYSTRKNSIFDDLTEDRWISCLYVARRLFLSAVLIIGRF